MRRRFLWCFNRGLHCLLRPVSPNTYGKYAVFYRSGIYKMLSYFHLYLHFFFFFFFFFFCFIFGIFRKVGHPVKHQDVLDIYISSHFVFH